MFMFAIGFSWLLQFSGFPEALRLYLAKRRIQMTSSTAGQAFSVQTPNAVLAKFVRKFSNFIFLDFIKILDHFIFSLLWHFFVTA